MKLNMIQTEYRKNNIILVIQAPNWIYTFYLVHAKIVFLSKA